MVPTAIQIRSDAGRFKSRPPVRDELYTLWAVAAAEANLALDAWRADPGARSYAVYVAAEDRASAAQDTLARHAA